MTIPFTKAHGAKNDFLLSWAGDTLPVNLNDTAIAICDRHTGIGADGWIVVSRGNSECNGQIRLFNQDGSEPEMSGNGTRCAAAFLMEAGLAKDDVRIMTGAGLKQLHTVWRDGYKFSFEMNMGQPIIEDFHRRFPLPLIAGNSEVAILNVGNPQCAMFVDNFEFDWRAAGAEIEAHEYFPKRTNVSFVRVIDPHTIDVRFYERGVGETMSSGTGATGAAAAAIVRGDVTSPVKILTPAGALDLRRDGPDLFLTGPAEILAKGDFYL
jgi:diaminopimelate epimerase